MSDIKKSQIECLKVSKQNEIKCQKSIEFDKKLLSFLKF